MRTIGGSTGPVLLGFRDLVSGLGSDDDSSVTVEKSHPSAELYFLGAVWVPGGP